MQVLPVGNSSCAADARLATSTNTAAASATALCQTALRGARSPGCTRLVGCIGVLLRVVADDRERHQVDQSGGREPRKKAARLAAAGPPIEKRDEHEDNGRDPED